MADTLLTPDERRELAFQDPMTDFARVLSEDTKNINSRDVHRKSVAVRKVVLVLAELVMAELEHDRRGPERTVPEKHLLHRTTSDPLEEAIVPMWPQRNILVVESILVVRSNSTVVAEAPMGQCVLAWLPDSSCYLSLDTPVHLFLGLGVPRYLAVGIVLFLH